MFTRIIHLLDRLDDINMGLWMPVVNQMVELKAKGINGQIISRPYPKNAVFEQSKIKHQLQVRIDEKPNVRTIINELQLDPESTLIISHGCWRFPSRLGYQFSKLGFHRIAVPHAMLMPWCMDEKALKKKVYFHFFEKKYLQNASCIQAVSLEEKKELQAFFPSVSINVLPNYIDLPERELMADHQKKTIFIFLGRLHSVKNISTFVEAWTKSQLNNKEAFECHLIGKDEGEGDRIKILATNSNNLKILGPLYGKEKENALQKGHFCVLPSLSEGMPTALLESMSYGMIPVCTDKCNLPSIFEEGIGYKIGFDVLSIVKSLELCASLNKDQIFSQRKKAQEFVLGNFGTASLNARYLNVFDQLSEAN